MAIPVITTEGPTSDKVACERGQPSGYSIIASDSPTSYAISLLPLGMTLDILTGIVTGTPTDTHNSITGIMTATNADGTSPDHALVWFISAPGTPVITSDLFINAIAGDPFFYQITATHSPTSWDAQGATGAGLIVNNITGLITGTLPGGPGGTVILVLSATNATGVGALTKLTIIVQAGMGGDGTPVITSPATYDLNVRDVPNYQITATNTPNFFGLTPIPRGFAIDTLTGLITGSAQRTAAVYTVTITATNFNGVGAKTLVITVTDPSGGVPPGPLPPPPASSEPSSFSYTEANSFAEDILLPCPLTILAGQVPPSPTDLLLTFSGTPGDTTGLVTWTPPAL